MNKSVSNNHPYHDSVNKNVFQKLLDFGVPLVLFLLYFKFYNFGKISPSEMIKTTGLLAIALLSITLLVGPLCRFIPSLYYLKAHRKFWGILSFITALTHAVLVYVYYSNYDFYKLFNTASPKYFGILAGVIALIILLVVAITSSQKILNSLNPKAWKIIQSTAYLALIFAVLHFYLVESINGVLVIKRMLGKLTYYFATAVIIIRLIVLFFPKKIDK